MPISRTCDVACARLACGAAAEDCLLLQEQLAFVTDHLNLLLAHHYQLCQQQQDLIREWDTLARGSSAWVWTMNQIRSQCMEHRAVWRDICTWCIQRAALHEQLRLTRSIP